MNNNTYDHLASLNSGYNQAQRSVNDNHRGFRPPPHRQNNVVDHGQTGMRPFSEAYGQTSHGVKEDEEDDDEDIYEYEDDESEDEDDLEIYGNNDAIIVEQIKKGSNYEQARLNVKNMTNGPSMVRQDTEDWDDFDADGQDDFDDIPQYQETIPEDQNGSLQDDNNPESKEATLLNPPNDNRRPVSPQFLGDNERPLPPPPRIATTGQPGPPPIGTPPPLPGQGGDSCPALKTVPPPQGNPPPLPGQGRGSPPALKPVPPHKGNLPLPAGHGRGSLKPVPPPKGNLPLPPGKGRGRPISPQFLGDNERPLPPPPKLVANRQPGPPPKENPPNLPGHGKGSLPVSKPVPPPPVNTPPPPGPNKPKEASLTSVPGDLDRAMPPLPRTQPPLPGAQPSTQSGSDSKSSGMIQNNISYQTNNQLINRPQSLKPVGLRLPEGSNSRPTSLPVGGPPPITSLPPSHPSLKTSPSLPGRPLAHSTSPGSFNGPRLPNLPSVNNLPAVPASRPPPLPVNSAPTIIAPTLPSHQPHDDNYAPVPPPTNNIPTSMPPPVPPPHPSLRNALPTISSPLSMPPSNDNGPPSLPTTLPPHLSINRAPASPAPPLPSLPPLNNVPSFIAPPVPSPLGNRASIAPHPPPPVSTALPLPPSLGNRASIAPHPPPPVSAAPPLPPHAGRRTSNYPPINRAPPGPSIMPPIPSGVPPPIPPHAEPPSSGRASPNPITSPGNVETMYLGETENVEITPLYRTIIDANYFHGITRTRSKTILEEYTDGTFLIRPSTRAGSPLALCVRSNNNTYTISIRQRRDGRLAMGLVKEGERSFGSVEEIVSCFRGEPIRLENGRQVLLVTTPPKTNNIYVRMPYYK